MPAPSENSGRAVHWGSLLIAAAALLAVGGFCGYFYHDYQRPNDKTPPLSTKPKDVCALGRIEPKDGILSLGVPVPDRIAKICVDEGNEVKSGDQLVKLESEELHLLEKAASEIQEKEASNRLQAIKDSGAAQIKVERLRVEQVKRFGPLEVSAQDRKIDFLTSQVTNAQNDHKHLERAGDSIAQQRKDKQELLWKQAKEELYVAEIQQKKLAEGQKLDVQLAEARLEAARAERERSLSTISPKLLENQSAQAKERHRTARITAPCDGTILRVLAHKGDLVEGKPVVQMANLKQMIVLAEVYEGDIERVHPDQSATITSYIGHIFQQSKSELKGKVIEIARIVGKPRVVSADPLAAVDRRVVEVKVELELTAEQAEKVAMLIGHQVRVNIEIPEKGQQ